MTSVGDFIGNIQLKAKVGQGGMGEVFEGWDSKLNRRVAVKAIRRERMDSDSRARFLREGRALSLLKDPRICAIYDYLQKDQTDYLVLEFIEGQTLTEVIQAGTSQKRRLAIARDIAEVLMEAHQNGIIHRDLKPDNIMVCSDGTTKVLDFGLACSVTQIDEDYSSPIALPPQAPDSLDHTQTLAFKTSHETAANTFQTDDGRVLGTLHYMSPEQINQERMTPASDLFSLGLIIQEMWTGKSAFDPTTPFPTLVDAVATGATRAHRIPGEIGRLINQLNSVDPLNRPSSEETVRRLKWIQLRPTRLRRYLAVAAVVALMAASLFKYTFDLKRERNHALQQRDRANLAEAQSKASAQFLKDLFLGAAPEVAKGKDVSAIDLLDRASLKLNEDLGDDPVVIADMLHTLGNVYMSMGKLDQAQPLLERAKQQTPASDAYLSVLFDLGALYTQKGHLDQAELTFRAAYDLTMRPDYQDDRHRSGAASMLAIVYLQTNRQNEAVAMLEQALEIRRRILPEGDIDLAHTMINLGIGYRMLGDRQRVVPLWQKALEIYQLQLGDEHPSTTLAMANLQVALREAGDFDEALNIGQKALEIREQIMGERHPEVAQSLNNLAYLLIDLERFSEAAELVQRSLSINREALGPDHPSVITNMLNLANIHMKADQIPETQRWLQTLNQQFKSTRQPTPAMRASVHYANGELALKTRNADRAREAFQQALDVYHAMDVVPAARTAVCAAALGEVDLLEENYPQAIERIRQAIAKMDEEMGERTHDTTGMLINLARAYRASGDVTAARSSLRRALEQSQAALPRFPSQFKACERELDALEALSSQTQ